MADILTPRCPVCDEEPMMVMGGGTQAFCGTDDCQVLTWDPSKSRAHFFATAKRVDLPPMADDEGKPDG